MPRFNGVWWRPPEADSPCAGIFAQTAVDLQAPGLKFIQARFSGYLIPYAFLSYDSLCILYYPVFMYRIGPNGFDVFTPDLGLGVQIDPRK